MYSILTVGAAIVSFIIGFFYSESSPLRGGSLGTAMMQAMLFGFGMYGVYKLGGCSRLPAAHIAAAIVIAGTAPLVAGHVFGYYDAPYVAFRQVQRDDKGVYPAEWKKMAAPEVFPLFVGHLTGRPGRDIFAYARMQTTLGWQGMESGRRRRYVDRQGLQVWFIWFLQWAFFVMASAAAFAFAADEGRKRK